MSELRKEVRIVVVQNGSIVQETRWTTLDKSETGQQDAVALRANLTTSSQVTGLTVKLKSESNSQLITTEMSWSKDDTA